MVDHARDGEGQWGARGGRVGGAACSPGVLVGNSVAVDTPHRFKPMLNRKSTFFNENSGNFERQFPFHHTFFCRLRLSDSPVYTTEAVPLKYTSSNVFLRNDGSNFHI